MELSAFNRPFRDRREKGGDLGSYSGGRRRGKEGKDLALVLLEGKDSKVPYHEDSFCPGEARQKHRLKGWGGKRSSYLLPLKKEGS